MKPIIMTPGRNLAGRALARNLYTSVIKALAELIFNGLDAAHLKGTKPKIEIRFWAPGEHPLSPDGPAITVTDNGTGFTDSVIDAYCKVGDSVHTAESKVHGKHGLGKLSALALSPENGWYYITTSTGDDMVWRFQIMEQVFDAAGFEPVRVTNRAGLPRKGSFTEICVPNAQLTGITPERLLAELPNILPIREWTVTVQGQPVQRRSFTAQAKEKTPHIPNLGGPVLIDLATSGVSADSDSVLFIDSSSGRIVGDSEMLKGVRRRVDGAIYHPRLIGEIRVPGLESDSAASRTGLNSTFWDSPRGEALIGVLNAYAAPVAKQVLGPEETSGGSLQDALRGMEAIFTEAFGPAEFTTRSGGGGGNGGGGGGGGGTRTPKPEGAGVNIDGVSYQVMTFATADPGPSCVRKGDVIVINTNHPEVKRLVQARAPRVLQEAMVQWAIEAHVSEKVLEGTGDPLFSEVYRIKHAALSRQGKE